MCFPFWMRGVFFVIFQNVHSLKVKLDEVLDHRSVGNLPCSSILTIPRVLIVGTTLCTLLRHGWLPWLPRLLAQIEVLSWLSTSRHKNTWHIINTCHRLCATWFNGPRWLEISHKNDKSCILVLCLSTLCWLGGTTIHCGVVVKVFVLSRRALQINT